MEVVASLSQGLTAAAQCGLFTHKSVPVIFEPPCTCLRLRRQKVNQYETFLRIPTTLSHRSLCHPPHFTDNHNFCLPIHVDEVIKQRQYSDTAGWTLAVYSFVSGNGLSRRGTFSSYFDNEDSTFLIKVDTHLPDRKVLQSVSPQYAFYYKAPL